MPLAGSACQFTATTRISTSASQNTGTEMPANANRLMTVSAMPPGFSDAQRPSMNASTTLTTKLLSISLQVCSSAGTSTTITGWACVRE
jgi:hypothetical protein